MGGLGHLRVRPIVEGEGGALEAVSEPVLEFAFDLGDLGVLPGQRDDILPVLARGLVIRDFIPGALPQY